MGSTIGSTIGSAISSVVNTTANEKCLTKGQLSFKVGEEVQSTAVKNSHLSISN